MALPFTFTLLCALVFIALLWRDREYFRKRYAERDAEAVSLQRNLFDQMLLLKGFRRVEDDLQPKEKPRVAALDPDGLGILADRIGERVELGTMLPSEQAMLLQEVAKGTRSMDSVERILRERDQQMWGGSVTDGDQ